MYLGSLPAVAMLRQFPRISQSERTWQPWKLSLKVTMRWSLVPRNNSIAPSIISLHKCAHTGLPGTMAPWCAETGNGWLGPGAELS